MELVDADPHHPGRLDPIELIHRRSWDPYYTGNHISSRAVNVDARHPFVDTSAPMHSQCDIKTITRIISSFGFLLIQIPKLRYTTIGLVAGIAECGFDCA